MSKTIAKPLWGADCGIAAYPMASTTLPPVVPQKTFSIKPKTVDMASGTGSGTAANITYQGGLVLNGPTVYNVFVGDWSSAASQARMVRLNMFMKDLLASSWMTIFAQYGCTKPSTFAGSFSIPDPNANKAKQDDSVIETILQNSINSKALPEPSVGQVIFCLYTDESTGIADVPLGITMCAPTGNNSFGYHYHMTTNKGNDLFYCVIPSLNDQCLTNTGSCGPSLDQCSLMGDQTQEQRQTQVIAHEIAETITNPMGNGGWYDVNTGKEEGDLCNGDPVTITVGPNSWTVQEIYSKVDGNSCVAAAGAGTSAVPLADIQAQGITLLSNKYNLAGGAILLVGAMAYAYTHKKGAGDLIALCIMGFAGGVVITELAQRYLPATDKTQIKQIVATL